MSQSIIDGLIHDPAVLKAFRKARAAGDNKAELEWMMVAILQDLDALRSSLPAPPKLAKLVISLFEEPPMSAFVLSDDKTPKKLTVVGADAGGNPVPVAGAVTWSSSDPATVSVTPSADGLTCDIAAAGALTAPGTSVQIVATDVETGGTFTGSADVTVIAGPLASLQVVAAG